MQTCPYLCTFAKVSKCSKRAGCIMLLITTLQCGKRKQTLEMRNFNHH